MNENGEKKRTANFMTEETGFFLELVKKYRHIIQCKQSDKILWSKKNHVWSEIATLFNANSGTVYRDAAVLKKKYDNVKKVTKKRYADEKCALHGTGGGPSMPSSITKIDEEVKALIGMQVDGLDSVYDSDRIQGQYI